MKKNKKSIIEHILTAIVVVWIFALPIFLIAMIWGYTDTTLVRAFLTIFVVSWFSFIVLAIQYED